MLMSDEVAFDMCFPGLKNNLEKDLFKLEEMPYKLMFKDICAYGENC